MLTTAYELVVGGTILFFIVSVSMKSSPHLIKTIRTVRPYAKFIIFLAWIYIRFIGSVAPGPENLDDEMGFLDLFQKLFQSTADHMATCFAGDSSASSSSTIHFGNSAFTFSSLQLHIPRLALYTNDFLGIILALNVFHLVQYLHHFSWQEFKDRLIQSSFDFAKTNIPAVEKGFMKEEAKMEMSLKESMWEGRRDVMKILPKDGLDMEKVLTVSVIVIQSHTECLKLT
jgi:hypothetical protein